MAAVIAAVSLAQTGDRDHAERGSQLRRLEKVTWNPATEELTWTVAEGRNRDGGAGSRTQNYTIQMNRATMTFNGETRGFSRKEAADMHVLMDVLARYAAESTVWWEDGQGIRLDENGRPIPGAPGEGRRPGGRPDVKHPTPAPDTRTITLASR